MLARALLTQLETSLLYMVRTACIIDTAAYSAAVCCLCWLTDSLQCNMHTYHNNHMQDK